VIDRDGVVREEVVMRVKRLFAVEGVDRLGASLRG